MAPRTILRGESATQLAVRGPEAVVADGDELLSIRDQAHLEGYRTGYAAGTAAAEVEAGQQAERARNAIEAALGALRSAVALAERALEQEQRRLESAACDLSFGIAQAVLCRELALSHDPGQEAIARALAEIPTDADAVARLNPADVETIGDTGTLPPSVAVVPDPSVGPGGCVLEVGAAMVDARIETALERVRQVLDDAQGTP